MIYGYENTHDLYTDFRLIPSTFKKTKALVPCKHVNKLKKKNKPGVLRKPPPPKKKKKLQRQQGQFMVFHFLILPWNMPKVSECFM